MSDFGRGADGAFDEEAPVVRDRRRFDPTTGEVRAGVTDSVTPAPAGTSGDSPGSTGGAAAAGDGGAHALERFEAQIAERTADLQRLQAEYTNYRRRVDRDRQAVGEAALASVFANLLPVLDDIDRARAHDEVTGGFALVADGLEATLTKLGLERFGAAGEPFDPTLHEALTHGFSDDASEATCAEVFQSGFRVGERVLRPARVAVLEPEQAAAEQVLDITDDAVSVEGADSEPQTD